MSNVLLKELGLKPLCPTVIGSSAFPGWYMHLLEQSTLHPDNFGIGDLSEALGDATRLAVSDQLKAGIELISDGEMGRVDFNLGFYDYLHGIEPIPASRKWGAPAHDQRGKYVCTEPISAPEGLGTIAEFRRLKKITTAPKKMPIPGPFTLAGRLEGGTVYPDRDAITQALTPIINHEIMQLIQEGCQFIQLDEPSFACHPSNPSTFIDMINATLEGVHGAYVSLHMCFGNFRARAVAQRSYQPLFPALLSAHVDQFALEFASREMAEIELLRSITDAGKTVAVGLVDVKNLWIEPVDFLVDRIHACLKQAPADQLHICSDCGYSQTARYAACSKMKNMVDAVRQVRGN